MEKKTKMNDFTPREKETLFWSGVMVSILTVPVCVIIGVIIL